jgi:hypothetical protein
MDGLLPSDDITPALLCLLSIWFMDSGAVAAALDNIQYLQTISYYRTRTILHIQRRFSARCMPALFPSAVPSSLFPYFYLHIPAV